MFIFHVPSKRLGGYIHDCIRNSTEKSFLIARTESVDLFQQSFHDAEPFRVQRLPANGLPRSTVPIGCVTLIALSAMQVGVHPRALRSFVLLRRFVSPRPIALGLPPKSGEGE